MRNVIACLLIFFGLFQISLFTPDWCHAEISSGNTAPHFTLKDAIGKTYDLSSMENQALTILYFFDADSVPSQEGLLNLDSFAKKYKTSELTVWAITRSSRSLTSSFVKLNEPVFPVLLDDSDISDKYGARVILPTVCILGPQLKVLDYIRGGGKSSEILLTRLAERQLQRNRILLAKNLSKEVVTKNPRNNQAKAIHGYAVLKEGRLEEAEKTFKSLSEEKGSGEILGKEGLASVYLKKGQEQKAIKLAEEVEAKAPQRGNANLIKGNILIAKNQKTAAKEEFIKAAKKKETSNINKSEAYNQLGRIQASLENYKESRDLYDKAVEIDPYHIQAASNKGVSFEREGRWDMALSSYRQALSIDSTDNIAAVLSRNAEKRLALQNDTAKKQRVDKLVKELSQRFKSTKKDLDEDIDTWTSRPMILTFLDFSEKGGLADRDGLPTVLITHLSDLLSASGRVQVVERVIIEQLLSELNLGSSDLADPDTALRLGKVLSAKLIGTGTFYHSLTGSLLSFKLIDTETSEIKKVVTKQLQSQASLMQEINALNRDILKDIIDNYPLKGYVVQKSDERLMINLGSDHGVVLGTRFEVLKKQQPIQYKGKTLQPEPKTIAQLEVTEVASSLCYAKVIDQQQSFGKDDLVREKTVQ